MPYEFHPASPVPEAPPPPPALDLTTFSYEDRRVILPAVADALQMCGCWVLDRKPLSFTQTEFRFELRLHSILELYVALIGAGLELTTASHLDLTSLCTVRKHHSPRSAFKDLVDVRLEVSFLEDLTQPAPISRSSAFA
jgi:hypothetical protein